MIKTASNVKHLLKDTLKAFDDFKNKQKIGLDVKDCFKVFLIHYIEIKHIC